MGFLRQSWIRLRQHGASALFGLILAGVLINLAYLLWPTPPLVARLAPHPLSLARRIETMPVLVETQSTDGYAAMAWVDPAKPDKTVPAKTHSHKRKSAHPKVEKMHSGTLDLNTVGQAQLQRLPGVGPKMAERILDYRKTHGRFTSVDQLNEVKGIGDKKLAKMRGFCRV